MRENVFSPYFNKIDFEIILDSESGRPLDRDTFADKPGSYKSALGRRESATRGGSPDGRRRYVAVVVASKKRLVEGKRLPGWINLEVEELELQGYEVVPLGGRKELLRLF